LRPRLVLTALNGTVLVDPPGTNFAAGTVVKLKPVPSEGYYFTGWAGQVTGADVPLGLTLVSNLNVTANFRLLGDDFAGRILLSGSAPTYTVNNGAATKEPGEPRHANNAGGKSVWWKWTAPASGTATVSTLGSSLNTLIAVYTGTAVDALSAAIASSINRPLFFEATAGVEYEIVVDGFNGTSGNIELAVFIQTAPEADLRLTSPAVTADGTFQVLVEGPVGRTVTVEMSTDLSAWTTAGTVTIPDGGILFKNTGPGTVAKRYYRGVVRP